MNNFDIKKEPYSESASRDEFAKLSKVFKAEGVDFYADGFKIRGTGSMLNGNTVEYVYMAWAEQSSNTPYASEPNAR